MQGAGKAFGFVPNVLGAMAEAPGLLEAYTTLSEIFGKTSLSGEEQHTVLLTVSQQNGCTYCLAAHAAAALGSGMSRELVTALREGQELDEPRLEALRRLTAEMVDRRGWPATGTTERFTAAGFTQQQLLEVILGVGMKTLSNYTNHVVGPPLDAPFGGASESADQARS